MRRMGLPARDLQILDPILSYPSTVLGRERAIGINLEHIKAIITAQEVLLLNSRDPSVMPLVEELQRRILRHATIKLPHPRRVGSIRCWRHPSPTKEMLEPLLRTAAAVGLHLDVSTSKALADSLDCAVGDDPYFNKLIRILATRCMTQAVYFCSGDLSPQEFYHYGLSAPLYTHFTSPIRRYAGELLAASLGIYKLPAIFQDRPQLTSIADSKDYFSAEYLNYRHRNAQMASRASVEVHTLIYFRKRPTDTEARIVKIRSNGFIVFVPKYGIEGPVYLTARGDKGGGGEWLVDEQQQKVKKSDGSISYGVLQTVRIHMEVVEPQPNRPKLQLTLI
ncbi:hypothetical protein TEA_027536 [Camellia sinensis var. sinensis]|uniref:Uncharacterized protein n=1 Tax=Camellia sinensis var. sinensis TaxID=542762 RepID=A0A4V3WQJ0_CAMSN|nr:hypothetical protein TEA_027536 [Camellia sinensis var. sinensis]